MTSSSVETIGTLRTADLTSGLGVNLGSATYKQEWTFASVKAMGASHVRIQCGWSDVEKQTPPPANRPAAVEYVQTPACVAALGFAHQYGLRVTEVAAYGPPNHAILKLTTTANAAPGDTTLHVAFESGVGGDTLANLRALYDYVFDPKQLPGSGCTGNRPSIYLGCKHSYQGGLITAVRLDGPNRATLSLSSALRTGVPSGEELVINEILYPSAGTDSPTDPSVIAYVNYVQFLAEDMAQRGVQGEIELWNEPPWAGDPWDYRAALYDYLPSGGYRANAQYSKSAVVVENGRSFLSLGDGNTGHDPAQSPQVWTSSLPSNAYPGAPEWGANFGFVAAVMNRKFPAGVVVNWNGPSGSSSSSAMGPNMQIYSGVPLREPPQTVTLESHHPYGQMPEVGIAEHSCLLAAAEHNSSPYVCQLPGEYTDTATGKGSSNEFGSMYLTLKNELINPAFGLGQTVTETNIQTTDVSQRPAQARWNLRQYLGYMGEGYTYVEFFLFWDGRGNEPVGFNFVDTADNAGHGMKPWPTYTSMQGMMQDIGPMSRPPVRPYTDASLASVSHYSGTFPLDVVHAVGSRAGASANSEALFLWQRNYCATGTLCWLSMPPTPPALVAVTVPAGMHVTGAVNMTTRAAIRPRISGQQVMVPVSDDPVELLLDPGSR